MINDKKKKQVDADKAEAAIDQAFEMGYMQGYKDSKQEAMMEQAMQAQELATGAEGINPGAMPRPDVSPEQMGSSINSVPGDMQMPEAGQLTEATDNLINQLHGTDGDQPKEVQKAAKELATLVKSVKESMQMRKIEATTNGLKKNMNSLTASKRKVVIQQNDTIEHLMQKWEDESKASLKKLVAIANQHKEPEE